MRKFKFEIAAISATPSYSEVIPVQNFGQFIKSRGDINPAITRDRIEGTITLQGDDYDTCMGFFSTEYSNRFINFKISQDISGTYQSLIEGTCSIDSNIDSNRKKVDLTNFSNLDDDYDLILNNYDNEWSIYGQSLTEYPIYIEEDSTIYAIHAVPGTGYSQTVYKTYYTVNGNKNLAGTLSQDPRWSYFLFSHTIGTDEHVYVTTGFDFKVDPANITYTWTSISLTNFYIGSGGTTLYTNVYQKLWVTLPATTTSSYTIYNFVCVKGLQVIDIINYLLDIIDSSLQFTSSTGITYTGHTGTPTFNIDDLFLCEAKEQIYYANLDAKLSLKKIFDWMEQVFDLYWYLDGTALKFIHRTELTTSGSLDLSTQTAHLKQQTIQESEIPTYEKFAFKDTVGLWEGTATAQLPFGSLELTYLPNAPLYNGFRIIKETLVDLNTNTKVMFQNSGTDEIDGYILLNADEDDPSAAGALPLEHTSSTRGYGYDQNISFCAYNMFAFTNKSRYGDDADLTNRLKNAWTPIQNIDYKPLYKQSDINYDPGTLLSSFSMLQAITTSLGTTQAIELSADLNSGNVTLIVEL